MEFVEGREEEEEEGIELVVFVEEREEKEEDGVG